MDVVMVYSTWPDVDSARSCGEKLIEGRKAACATILPGAVSVYRWQGKVESAGETVLFVKTSASRAIETRDAIVANHPYELPCVTVLRIDDALSHAAFVSWISSEVD